MRPQQTSSGFAWLREIDPSDRCTGQALARIALPLVQALREFERTAFAAFADRFAARDLLRDRAGHDHARPKRPTASHAASLPTAVCSSRRRRPACELHSGEVSVRARTAPRRAGGLMLRLLVAGCCCSPICSFFGWSLGWLDALVGMPRRRRPRTGSGWRARSSPNASC